MTQWYYADAANVQQGPFDAETLVSAYAAGNLGLDTLVWRAGLAGWQPLSTMAAELGLIETPEATQSLDTAVSPVESADFAATPATAVAAPGATAHVQYAGFWRRFAANFIDSITVGLLALPITLPLTFASGFAMEHGRGNGGAFAGWLAIQLAMQAIGFVLTVLYFSCFHASRLMASPGKLAVGIKVVRGDGERLTFGRSLCRGLAYYLSLIPLCLGFLPAAFTQRKQALHDMICDTLVVDRWAFTDTPERQVRGLDTVSIVILVIYALMMLLVLGLAAFVVVAALAAAGSH